MVKKNTEYYHDYDKLCWYCSDEVRELTADVSIALIDLLTKQQQHLKLPCQTTVVSLPPIRQARSLVMCV
jgi:hypothetical protein